MTPGVDGQTFDGYSPEKVCAIIAKLLGGTYKPAATCAVSSYPKPTFANGRSAIPPTTEDRLVQEVVRILLNEIYEPLFHEDNHGFREGRSCHTALKSIYAIWTGVKWLVDVDVVGFFDNIDHAILIRLLEKRIADQRFIALIRGMRKAGYMEDWRFHRTLSGTPQGGVVSPLLAIIYLHELDEWMQARMAAFNKGKRRAMLPDYCRSKNRTVRLRRQVEQLRASGAPDPAAITSLLDEIGRQKCGKPDAAGHRQLRSELPPTSLLPLRRRLSHRRDRQQGGGPPDHGRGQNLSGRPPEADGLRGEEQYHSCVGRSPLSRLRHLHPCPIRTHIGRTSAVAGGHPAWVKGSGATAHVPREKVLRFVRDKKWGRL